MNGDPSSRRSFLTALCAACFWGLSRPVVAGPSHVALPSIAGERITTFTYDANGSVTSYLSSDYGDSATTYTYDSRGRLVSIVTGKVRSH